MSSLESRCSPAPLPAIARTLVNLVGVFDVSPLHELTENGRHPYCDRAIRLNGFQCGCALRDGELGEMTRARMRWLQSRYSACGLRSFTDGRAADCACADDVDQRLVKIARDYATRNYSDLCADCVLYRPSVRANSTIAVFYFLAVSRTSHRRR